MKRVGSRGFHGIILVIIVTLGLIVVLVGVFAVRHGNNLWTDSGSQEVQWAYNEQTQEWYEAQGTAPPCNDPFVFDVSPVDLSRVMVIGMPGAYRGYNYKPHGGFRLIDETQGKVDIRLPIDATLVGITRYYEGEPAALQYLLTFESDCGIALRFDHLYTLTPRLQAIAETTPEPRLNDTRIDPNISFTRTFFKAGDSIASAVGSPAQNNYGFDFGVYDYRTRNAISANAQWAALHTQYQALEWYGRCWIDMLPASDVKRARELSLTVINPARPHIVSDYCEYAPSTTLDFNNGEPTDG